MSWRLLLVEDNPGDARLIRELLTDELDEPPQLQVVETLADGAREVRDNGWDAVLLDLSLPDSQGLATLRVMLDVAAGLPVLVLTGLDDEQRGTEAVRLGAQEYLVKGKIGGQALVRSIRYAIERRRLERELRQVQKLDAVGRLSGGVAHELNNLLQAMLASLQLMRLELVLPPEGDEQVGEMEELVKRAAELTRQLLMFARRSVQRRVRLDLNRIVPESMSLLRRMLPDEVRLEIVPHPGPLEVEVDRSQLEQLLANLLANAREAMPDGGAVTVTIGSCEDGRVCLEVADTGVGMSPEVAERACDPFFTTRRGSSGLGLAVAHGIAAQHGGSLELESQPGEGTKVTVSLPLAAGGANQEATAASAAAVFARGAGERVLLVEDEEPIRTATHRLLERLGYRVTSVATADEAGILPPEPGFDLLIADVSLGGVSGVRLATGLRERWPALPVILTSGHDEAMVREEQQAPDDMLFLQKPAELAALAATVRTALTTAATHSAR